MITATKEFSFDCAHLLSGHTGLCKNLHGHTYKMLVTIGSDSPLETAGPAEGMIVDFKHIKNLVKDVIVDKYDHACVIWKDTKDPFEMELRKLLEKHNKKRVLVDYRPTAESMASHFMMELNEFLVRHEASHKVVKIQLFEIPTSYAEVIL